MVDRPDTSKYHIELDHGEEEFKVHGRTDSIATVSLPYSDPYSSWDTVRK